MDAIHSTKERLQLSAVNLVERMIAVKWPRRRLTQEEGSMLTESERLRLVDLLETAARNVVEAKQEMSQRSKSGEKPSGPSGRLRKWQERLAQVWQEFPECNGESPPDAEECLSIVARIRDEIEADRRFEEQMKAK